MLLMLMTGLCSPSIWKYDAPTIPPVRPAPTPPASPFEWDDGYGGYDDCAFTRAYRDAYERGHRGPLALGLVCFCKKCTRNRGTL